MNNYYNEIEHLIKKNEVNKRARVLINNSETLEIFWNIGRIIVEAQGGKSRSKYGDGLIKEWSVKLTKLYGSNYSERKLRDYRMFYLTFLKWHPLDAISWSHIRIILPIKDENKRNYYINLCIIRNLSKRELINEIKSESYERLLNKPDKIDIIDLKEKHYNVRENIKNPIIIKLDSNEKILKEKDLQIIILSKLKNFFTELGLGYTYVGNEYKIKYGDKYYFIDILLFNVEINSYVVVELKLRELKREDKSQIEFYMNIIDNTLKREFHNKTVGIIVTKRQDKLIATFVSRENVIPITYQLECGEEHICE